MKTEEQIFNTDEEAFKAMDEYVKQEAIAFNALTKKYILVDDNLYTDTELKLYTTEELYSLYLQLKEK